MNCHSVAAVLDLHAEGRLTARRRAAVEAHLAACAACLDAISHSTAASAPGAKRPGVPNALKARLAKALKSAPAPTPEPAPLAMPAWPRDLTGVAWAAAALALVALGVGWSGAPSQQYDSGDELAARRVP